MSDNLSNNAFTLIDGNQTDSTTTVNVVSTANFPAGPFWISVQNPKKMWGEAVTSGEGEIMLAEVNDATSFTVTRAQGGTSAVALTDGWAVYQNIASRLLDQKADLEGSTSQTFNVATATAAEHAVRKEQAALLTGGADANFTAMPQVDGVPIVASGSNSDGRWTRWADGTQTTTKAGLLIKPSSSTAAASYNVTWTFPASFSSNPTFISHQVKSGEPGNRGNNTNTTESTTSVVLYYQEVAGAVFDVFTKAIAIGTWS